MADSRWSHGWVLEDNIGKWQGRLEHQGGENIWPWIIPAVAAEARDAADTWSDKAIATIVQLSRLRLLGVAILLCLSATPVWAADLQVSVVSLSSPVAPFSDATLEIQTAPGAICTITVHYKSGPSRAKGLAPKTADARGRVVWQWRVGSNTTPGQWPLNVTCQKGEVHGDVRTSFEVR